MREDAETLPLADLVARLWAALATVQGDRASAYVWQRYAQLRVQAVRAAFFMCHWCQRLCSCVAWVRSGARLGRFEKRRQEINVFNLATW